MLNGKNGKQVIIISAYRACKARLRSGTHTAYMQQVKQFMKRGVVAPNPRKAVLNDLRMMIEEHHSSGGGIVLMKDANEDW